MVHPKKHPEPCAAEQGTLLPCCSPLALRVFAWGRSPEQGRGEDMEKMLGPRLVFFLLGTLEALPHTGDSSPSTRFFSPSLE